MVFLFVSKRLPKGVVFMKKMIICPSLMCADFDSLKDEVVTLDKAGADIFHIDIMDGSFVPNFGMGLQDVETVRRNTSKLIDVHLMIDNPGEYVELFVNLGADIIYIHPEADKHPARTLAQIKKLGKSPGIAINPGTSLESIKPLFHLIDYLMIMTVNPGFAGQKYLNYVDEKIKETMHIEERSNFKVMVDGAISPEKIQYLHSLGVDGFVLGTSALFGKNSSYKDLIKEYKGFNKEEI